MFLRAELKICADKVGAQELSPTPLTSEAAGDFKRLNDQGSLQKNQELNQSLEHGI